ncbi:MAG: hypothetical protein M1393_00280 [Candidatus Thermoplasmatota archaeon]|jgi:hypothetical protein|nr:hypothetical protein [Candidatus Thermoplasmatota archaeon]MCL6089463.1 hypothetical protein [Candidatus Thermoplasmatota archaeon]MDA8144106.1 hypothetical protein [Thermoplasmatales archaeon]
MYAIYLLKKSDRVIVDNLLSDDLLGRQTITQKDGSNFSVGDENLIILYEGSEEGNAKIKQLFSEKMKALDSKASKEIYDKIKEEDARAEGGLGFLFG